MTAAEEALENIRLDLGDAYSNLGDIAVIAHGQIQRSETDDINEAIVLALRTVRAIEMNVDTLAKARQPDEASP